MPKAFEKWSFQATAKLQETTTHIQSCAKQVHPSSISDTSPWDNSDRNSWVNPQVRSARWRPTMDDSGVLHGSVLAVMDGCNLSLEPPRCNRNSFT